MAHDLRISVLGGFDVSLDGRLVEPAAWRRNRARALVKLLSLAAGHRLHREQLIDALWPSLDPAAGGRNLRKAVHFARQAIGTEHIRTQGELVRLAAPSLFVDVRAFEDAVQAGRRSEALALYRGDLLPEDPFEPWSEDPRERLRVRFTKLLLEEAHSLERDGRLDAATEAFERLVANDPLHEEAYVGLIRLLASSGSRHLALARYRQLEERLRAELDVEPEPRLRDLAEKIASGHFLPQERAAGPPMEEPAAGSTGGDADELRLVTALSAAIDPSASDPELAQRALDDWASEARAVLATWGGTTELQAGGDLLAIFGAPTAREDDPARALRAALEIRALRAGTSRVGVATGEVVIRAGQEPALRRTTGPVIAEAAANRVAADPGAVLVSERTRLVVLGSFRFGSPASARPAGLVTSTRVLLGEEPGTARQPATDTPLIGREPELVAALGSFDEAIADRRPRLVEVTGPAGVGKSRLARELLDRIANQRPETLILRGRCLPGGRGGAFDALGEILREACGIAIADSADVARVRLRRAMSRLLGQLEPADAVPATFALAATAGISLPGNPLERLSPAELSDRVALAWPVFASACAALGPAVFLIEDVHWARPELLDLVERIVSRADGPFLMLVTARPELHETRQALAPGDVSTITLRPLGEAHSGQLLDNLLGSTPLDARVRRDLLTRAEGNPFYIEQLIHHIQSGGAGSLPDTLHTLLGARLDRLPAPERRVLQEASVVGRVFWEAPIAAALVGERVAARLASLERKGFVTRRPTSSLSGQAEYAFRHALLHDVAYESLSRGRRARAHAATGAWLEALAGDRVDEVIALLAHHYTLAASSNLPVLAPDDGVAWDVVRAKAFDYALRAGDAARRRFVTDRAIELHRHAIELATTDDERMAALEALGQDHEVEFHGDDAAHQFREALDIARSDPGRAADRARLCRRLAWMMAWNPGAFRVNPDAVEAEALVDEGMAQAADDAERTWLSLVRGACARLYRGSEPLGQGTATDPRPIAERVRTTEEALARARELGLDDVVVAAEDALGMLYGLAGDYESMVDLARRQVAGLRPERSRIDQSDAIRKLAINVINVRADFEQGLELGRRCRELLGSSGAGGPHQVMHALWPILASLFFLGRWEELLTPLDEHVEAFRLEPAMECQFVRDGPAIGAATLTLLGRPAEAVTLAGLLGDPLADQASASAWQARLALLAGDPAAARTISNRKALEGRVYGPQHAAVLLDALAALGDWDAASTFLPLARSAAPGNALIEPIADRVAGLVRMANGEPARASSLLRRSARGFVRLNVPFEEARSLEALARALRPSDATATRAAALAIYQRLGAGPAAGRASVAWVGAGG